LLNVAPETKVWLRGVSDATLYIIGAAAPVVASQMLRQYLPQIAAADVPVTVQQLKNLVSQHPSLEVPLGKSLPGLTQGPLEVEASLQMQTPIPAQTQWSPSATTAARVAQTLKAVNTPPLRAASSLTWQTPGSTVQMGPQLQTSNIYNLPSTAPQTSVTDAPKEYETRQPPLSAIRTLMAARDLLNIDWMRWLQMGGTVASMGLVALKCINDPQSCSNPALGGHATY
jgi:hypothetical protein